jgi:adenylate cyclase
MDKNQPRSSQAGIADTPAPSAALESLRDWLTDQALVETEVDDLVTGFCARLHAVGIPIWRGHVTFRTLHPLHGSRAITWRRDRGAELANHPRGYTRQNAPQQWVQSPLYHLIH